MRPIGVLSPRLRRMETLRSRASPAGARRPVAPGYNRVFRRVTAPMVVWERPGWRVT